MAETSDLPAGCVMDSTPCASPVPGQYHLLDSTTPWTAPPSGQHHPPWTAPPPLSSQQASSTNPTGMLSCYGMLLPISKYYSYATDDTYICISVPYNLVNRPTSSNLLQVLSLYDF